MSAKNTISFCTGLDRTIRALTNTPGLNMEVIIPPLVRKVDEVLFNDSGQGYVRSGPIYLENKQWRQIEEVNAKAQEAVKPFLTNNLVPNIGFAILRDRMGYKITPDSKKEALEWLGIGGAENE